MFETGRKYQHFPGGVLSPKTRAKVDLKSS